MTAELSSKLDRITAYLRKALEVSSAATQGPWGTEDVFDNTNTTIVAPDAPGEGSPNAIGSMLWGDNISAHQAESDAAFIAFSREFTPAAAQALLTAIEALDAIQILNTGYTENRALEALQSIASNFPDHLLL